jgi:CBS domain-containing protein
MEMSLNRYVKKVATVSPRAMVADAAEHMSTQAVGAIVVVSDDGRPIGMLTDRDIVLRVVAERRDPERTPIEEVMTRGTAYLSHNASVQDATEIMRDCGMRRLPLVDAEGKLDGIVSLDDIVLLLGMELGNVSGALFANLSAGSVAEPIGTAHQQPTEKIT